MKRTEKKLLVLIATILLAIPLTGQAQQSHTEDFTTSTYKDAVNTIADWNTADGELKLFPFEPTLAGSYDTPDRALGVAVAGDYAYVANRNSGLLVIDIKDPDNPTLAGSYVTGGSARGVTVSGNFAFLADKGVGLSILDISTPTSPTLTGSYNTPDWAERVVVAGRYAYVADRTSGLQVIDINDPTSPTLAGTYDTPGEARDVAVSGNLAFVADLASGLLVLDITNPASPDSIGTYDTPGNAHGIAVSGNLAFVADGLSGLQVIDISTPTSPTLTGTYGTPVAAYDVAISGDLAFVADDASGLQAIDISDPTSPVHAYAYNTPGNARGVVVAGEHAFVADYTAGGLQVINVRDFVGLTNVAGYGMPTAAEDIVVASDHAYIANGSDGLRVIDISDPTSPAYAGSYNLPEGADAVGVAVSGDHAFLAAKASGLQLIDINDPTSPTFAGSYNTPGWAMDVVVSGDFAFVADNWMGLQVIDISDPTSPTFAGTYTTPHNAMGVAVSGDHAFVAADAHGLVAINILDTSNPTFADYYNTPGGAYDVAVSGNYAYVADNTTGLLVIDISDPTSLTLAGSVAWPGSHAYRVSVSGDFAFVADTWDELQVIDISDPTSPQRVGTATFGESARGVAVSGDFVFVAALGDGLQVVRAFQHELDLNNNVGQSLAVDGGSDTFPRARLASTQTAGVSWELSANGGWNWQAFTPDGSWNQFTMPGNELLWRSTHTGSPGLNPTVSDLTIDWLTEYGPITSITDIPDDQGGWVRLDFTRSGYDFADEANLPVTGYGIYRRVDNLALKMQVLEAPETVIAQDKQLASFDPSQIRKLGDRTFILGGGAAEEKLAGAFPSGTWELIQFNPATQQDSYLFECHAVADSTAGGGIHWSVFMATTHTTTPSIWFASEPDSGYSVDNIAPGVPVALVADYQTDGVSLNWDDAPEPDFQHHRIYRSTDPGFIPDEGNLVHETASSAWTDDTTDPWGYYYKITTLDYVGNESEAAEPGTVSDVGENVVPVRTALLAAYPNPFNPSTKLSFELAAPARVRLNIFDAAGRLVNTLVDEQRGAGRHEFIWNGQNTAGQSVASGVYLYRFEAGDVVQTKRMMLVK